MLFLLCRNVFGRLQHISWGAGGAGCALDRTSMLPICLDRGRDLLPLVPRPASRRSPVGSSFIES